MTVHVLDGSPKRLLQQSGGSTVARPVDYFRSILSVPIENCTDVPTEIAHSGRLLSV